MGRLCATQKIQKWGFSFSSIAMYATSSTARERQPQEQRTRGMHCWWQWKLGQGTRGQPLAAHVVMAGDYNKGGYTEGKLFNEAVISEGIPLKPFDLEKGTCPINGAASWDMVIPLIRVEITASSGHPS